MRSPTTPSSRPRPKHQVTLHDCAKVVTSRTSSYYNVNLEDVMRLKKTIEDVDASKDDVVHALRQLASMMMSTDLLAKSLVGKSVKRISRKHGDGEVRAAAKAIAEKWSSDVVGAYNREMNAARKRIGFVKARR